jgi:predicted secreted protein
MKDGGEVSLELNFVPGSATKSRLQAALEQTNAISAKIVFPDSPATTWTFDTIVTAVEAESPLDDKMALSVTLKVTGQPLYA